MSLRCLIVDDDPGFTEAARARLERQGLRVVATARTSREALQRVQELGPDLALVDIGLGEESGFDLAERLHADHGFPMPVILISTRDESDLVELIEASPAVGFVPKSRLSAQAVYDLLGRDGGR